MILQSLRGNWSSHEQQLPDVFLCFPAAARVGSVTVKASDAAPVSSAPSALAVPTLLCTTAPRRCDA